MSSCLSLVAHKCHGLKTANHRPPPVLIKGQKNMLTKGRATGTGAVTLFVLFVFALILSYTEVIISKITQHLSAPILQ